MEGRSSRRSVRRYTRHRSTNPAGRRPRGTRCRRCIPRRRSDRCRAVLTSSSPRRPGLAERHPCPAPHRHRLATRCRPSRNPRRSCRPESLRCLLRHQSRAPDRRQPPPTHLGPHQCRRFSSEIRRNQSPAGPSPIQATTASRLSFTYLQVRFSAACRKLAILRAEPTSNWTFRSSGRRSTGPVDRR
jgi:hypothetical protein